MYLYVWLIVCAIEERKRNENRINLSHKHPLKYARVTHSTKMNPARLGAMHRLQSTRYNPHFITSNYGGPGSDGYPPRPRTKEDHAAANNAVSVIGDEPSDAHALTT